MIHVVTVLAAFLFILASLIIEYIRVKKECGYFNIDKPKRVYAVAAICKNNETQKNPALSGHTLTVFVKDGDSIRILAIRAPKLFFNKFIKVRVERDYVDVIYEKNNLCNIRFYDLSTIACIIALRMIKWVLLLIILLIIIYTGLY